MGHQQENYWVQSAVLALQIKGGLQSRELSYESNKKKKKKKEAWGRKGKKKKKAQAPTHTRVLMECCYLCHVLEHGG